MGGRVEWKYLLYVHMVHAELHSAQEGSVIHEIVRMCADWISAGQATSSKVEMFGKCLFVNQIPFHCRTAMMVIGGMIERKAAIEGVLDGRIIRVVTVRRSNAAAYLCVVKRFRRKSGGKNLLSACRCLPRSDGG